MIKLMLEVRVEKVADVAAVASSPRSAEGVVREK